MHQILPKSVTKLIEEFSKLPGIGPKTASRLTFFMLNQPNDLALGFGKALIDLRTSLTRCKNCFTISENDLCPICADSKRDKNEIMVVAEPLDMIALERTGFTGVYHVLGGAISPIDGIGPEDLRIGELLDKLKQSSGNVKELILATNPSLEGEATALYIARAIDKIKAAGEVDQKLLVTRIARGLPVGGDVEYADEVTLARALEGRKSI